MGYYVYEILIDDVVRYVGTSQRIEQRYPENDPHHWKRLKDHGYFTLKTTAERLLKTNKIGKRRLEILLAILNDKKLSFNIVAKDLSPSEAHIQEQRLISKYGIMMDIPAINYDEQSNELTYSTFDTIGQLTNKINSPKNIVKNKNGFFKTTNPYWWYSLSAEEQKAYSIEKSLIWKNYIKNNPDGWERLHQKMIEGSKLACGKLTRSQETLKKQSDAMKRRWARNESWIPAKNELSRIKMYEVATRPEQIERSRNACILRNKDPKQQLLKVCKLYKLIKANNLSFDNWRESHDILVKSKLYPKKSFRDWTKYFDSEAAIKNFIKENEN